MIAQAISVDGTDVAGYTALQHSLSCISLVKSFRWSQMLLDANPTNKVASINHRDRYGSTAMHSVVMSMRRPGETDLRGEVLDWLLENHANCDIPDNDGTSARTTAKHTPGFREKMEEWDELVTDGYACQFCRRGKVVGKGKAKAESIPGELRANLRCSACRLVSCESPFSFRVPQADIVPIDCSAECQKVSSFTCRLLVDTDDPPVVHRWTGEGIRRNASKNEMQPFNCAKSDNDSTRLRSVLLSYCCFVLAGCRRGETGDHAVQDFSDNLSNFSRSSPHHRFIMQTNSRICKLYESI